MPQYRLEVEYHVRRTHEFEADDIDDAENQKDDYIMDDEFEMGDGVEIWHLELEEVS